MCPNTHSLGEAVVLFENFAEFVVRQGDDFVIFDAGHGFGRNHGVNHRLFGRLHRRGKDRVEMIIRKHFQIDDVVGSGGPGIGGGERDENIAGTVMKISPEPLPEMLPLRPSPRETRRARRFS